jgi:HEPN domain-containing protein
MSNRHADWFRQAEADLQHARNSLESGDFEWSCFAAHQAAEKALKFESGVPTDFYTAAEAQNAVHLAKEILEYCRNQIDRP